MPADTAPKRPVLKLPPVPGAAATGRPSSAAKAKSTGPTPPRLSVGAGPGGASQPQSQSQPPADTPRIAVGTAGPPPTSNKSQDKAGTATAPPTAGPATSARIKTAAKPRNPAKQAARSPREGGLAPGHTVKELRRPTGAVHSNPVVADVMRASLALADFLEEENTALRKHDIKAVKALAVRKEAATRLYRQKMLNIQKDPSTVTGLPEDERAAVRDLAQYLDAHLAENARLLKSAKACSERLMGLFVDAVRQSSTEKAPGYAADGRLTERAHVPSRMSLTFNENL